MAQSEPGSVGESGPPAEETGELLFGAVIGATVIAAGALGLEGASGSRHQVPEVWTGFIAVLLALALGWYVRYRSRRGRPEGVSARSDSVVVPAGVCVAVIGLVFTVVRLVGGHPVLDRSIAVLYICAALVFVPVATALASLLSRRAATPRGIRMTTFALGLVLVALLIGAIIGLLRAAGAVA